VVVGVTLFVVLREDGSTARAAPSQPPTSTSQDRKAIPEPGVLPPPSAEAPEPARAAEPSDPPVTELRTPQKLVRETLSMKEGEAIMFSFSLYSDAPIQVSVESSKKSINVMLMTGEDLEKYRRAKGKLLGGKYTYRQTLSQQNVRRMAETAVLPAGDWAIVVEVRQTSLLIMDKTSVSVDVTAH
jgi:hypothetical protein